MSRKLILFTVFATLLALCYGSPAKADTIGTLSLTDCGSGGSGCPAATYMFDIGTSMASLSIDITGTPVSGTSDHITGVDLGFTPSNDVTLTGATFPGGTGWTFSTGSLSNAGCGSNGGAFVCSSSALGVAISTGHTYTWTWSYAAIPASDIFAVGDVHIGANYGPHNGLIVSETGATGSGPGPGPSPVPEPSSLMLFGSGLLGLTGLASRKWFSRLTSFI